MLPDSREVRDYFLNLKLKLRKRDLLWGLVLILPGGFIVVALYLLATNKLKVRELFTKKSK